VAINPLHGRVNPKNAIAIDTIQRAGGLVPNRFASAETVSSIGAA